MYRNSEGYADPTAGWTMNEHRRKTPPTAVTRKSQRPNPERKTLVMTPKDSARILRERWNAKLHSCWFCKGDCEIVTAPAQGGKPPMGMVRCKSCGARGPAKYDNNPIPLATASWNDVSVTWANMC